MQLRSVTTILSCLILSGCAASSGQPVATRALAWDRNVRVYGALRAIMHEGKTGANVTIAALLPNPDLYALGALADLSGEVTIVGGKVYLSYPGEGNATRTETMNQTDAAATLLVVSGVPAWHGIVTARAIAFEELDGEIAKIATAAGMSLDERFPFLMQGEFEDLRWHVVDGRRLPAGSATHQDHQAAAAKVKLDRASATLLGFYSEIDQGVFTHMGSKTHIHCTLDDPLSTGHVDHVTIPAGTRIQFPVIGTAGPLQASQRTCSSAR
jgi:acetolactate decarboxylase